MTLLSGGSIDVNQGISLHGNLEIDAIDGVSIAGSLDAGAINMTTGGGIDLTSAVSANNLTLVDTSSLYGVTLAAPITVGTAFAASIVAGGLVEQPSDRKSTITLSAGTLSSDGGTIGGGVQLANSGNSIGTIGGLTINNGAGSIATGGQLILAGVVADPGQTLSLYGAQGISESGGGVIDLGATGYLNIVNPAASVGVTLGNHLNQLGTISAISVSGADITLADKIPLTLNHYLSATNIALYGQNVALNASLYAAKTLIFGGSGTFSELSGASISAATIKSGTGLQGDVDLSQGYNTIGAVGSFSIAGFPTGGGSLSLVEQGPLTISGPINAAGNVSFNAQTIGISSSINAAGISLASTGPGANGITGSTGGDLTSSGTIFVQGNSDISLAGAVNAVGLVVDIALGGATFSGPIQIGTLSSGSTTIGGGLTLGNVGNQIGTLNALSIAGGNAVIADASSLMINGRLDDPRQLITINDAAGITESSTGAIIASILSLANTTAAVDLANTLNSIDNFTGVTVGNGPFSLLDSALLTIAGTIEAPSILFGATGISIDAPVSAGTIVTLESTGAGITQSAAGFIMTPTLSTGTGSIVGSVDLPDQQSSATNQIGTLAAFSATGALTLDELGSLTINGLVEASSISFGAMAGLGEINGSLSTALFADGATLAGLTLGGQNTIATLAPINAGNNIIFVTDPGHSLEVSNGSFSASGITLNAAGLRLDGTLQAAGGTVALGSNSGVTQGSYGVIVATNLMTYQSLSGAVLLGGHNTIGTLGAVELGSTGSFNLADSAVLTIAGSLTATDATLGGTGVDILAPISVGTGGLVFDGSGVISEGASGAITAGIIEGTGTFSTVDLVPVCVNLNNIGSLGGLSASGDMSFSTGQFLTLVGAVESGGILALGAQGLAEGQVGAVIASTLAALVPFTTSVDLTGTANSFSNLASFTVTSGNFVLHDNDAVDLISPLTAPNVKLIDQAGLTFGSTISVATGGSIALISNVLVDQAGVFIAPNGTIAVAPYNDMALYLGSAGLSPRSLDVSSPLANALLGSAQLVVLGSASANGTQFLASSIIGTGMISSATNALALSSSGAFINNGTFAGGPRSSLQIDVVGYIDNTGALQAGTFNVTSGSSLMSSGLIDALTMVGSASNGISLTNSLNSILSIGGLSAGIQGILVDDAASLTLAGPIEVGPSAQISFLVNAVQAAAGASIVAPGGIVSFAPLTSTNAVEIGISAGSRTLLLDANLFGQISDNAATLIVGDTQSAGLVVNQGVSLGITNVSLLAASIAIDNSLIVPGTLDLLAGNGGVNQLEPIKIGNLTGAAFGAVVLNNAANQIGTLENFDTTLQSFSLADSENLVVDGILLANSAVVSATSLDVMGSINVPDTLSLSSSYGISEAGSITAGVLIGNSSGAVSLTGNNAISDLASFNVFGNSPIYLHDRSQLLVSGTVTAGDVTLNANGLSISGNIDTPGSLAFGGSGAITETGSITATSVGSSGLVQGNIALLGTNNINDLGNFTVSGGFGLDDLSSLTVTAPLRAAAATLTADGIAIPSLVSVAGVLALNSSASIKETGSIIAGTLINSVPNSGSVELIGTNLIGYLGPFSQSGAGTLLLDDGHSLTEIGLVSGGLVSLNVVPGLSIAGTISVATLALGGGPVMEAPTGAVDGVVLQSDHSIAGDVSLVGNNSIAQIAGFYDNGSLVIHDGTNLLLGGTVSAANAAFDVPSLTLGGLLALVNSVTINSSGNVVEPGSLIVGTSLNGSIGGDISLTGTNEIASIGTLTGDGRVIVTDATPLTVAGTLDAQAAYLTSPSMAVAGLVSVASTLSLSSSSGVSELGAIDAGLLIWSGAAGQNALLTGVNSIATLGNFGDPGAGTLALLDKGLLVVAGPVSGAVASLSAGTIDITGAISVSNSLAIGASSVISETGSVIAPDVVGLGVIGGDVSLTGQNHIGALGSFSQTSSATLDLIDATPLTIGGPVTGGSATLSAAGLNFTGALSMPGTVALASSAGIAETGSIAAGVLTSENPIIGNAVLTGSNTIAVLGNFSDQGLLDLSDSTDLTVAGTIVAPTATLTASSLAVSGLVSVSGALGLGSSSAFGGISETGMIAANTLVSVGVINGNALLTNANLIGTLGAWNNTGSFALADDQSLTVAGPFDAGAARLQAPSINFAGPVAVNTVLAVQSTGSIVQTGGTIAVPTLVSNGVIGGSVNLGDANAILNLANFTVQGDLFLHDASMLTAGDPVSSAQAITLDASGIDLVGDLQAATRLLLGGSGPVTEATNAAIITPLLESFGTLTGAVQLDARNQIGTIGEFLLDNQPLSLIDSGSLTVIGPIAAKAVSLTAQGLLTLDGVAGGGLYISGVYETPPGATIAPNKPTNVDSVLTVNGSAPQLVQTGTFTIDGPPLAGTSVYPNSDNTVFVLFDPGQSNARSNATFQALQAPSTELILELNSGTSSGQVFLNRLIVVGNSGGRTNFIGTLGGVQGTGAAHNGAVFPFPSTNYQFNACPIGSVDCTILPIETLPETSPLLNFDLTPPRRRKLDRNVRLPGIAARDY